VVIGEPELDKAEAQAYLNGERAEPPTTTVQALLLDTEGNVARRVTVSPAENRVLSVEQIAPTLVPFTTDDLHAAWNLAIRDPAIRQALGPNRSLSYRHAGRFRRRTIRRPSPAAT
jgi:hypothetical protein